MNQFETVDILLVEDNPQDVELTLRAIKKHNLANNIHVAEDGAQALDYLFGRGEYAGGVVRPTPRVILLDLKLPKVNGLEVLKILKSDETTRKIPVIIVTSSQEDPDIKTAYALGANSYVVKPVGFEAFIDTMKNLGFYWLLVNKQPL